MHLQCNSEEKYFPSTNLKITFLAKQSSLKRVVLQMHDNNLINVTLIVIKRLMTLFFGYFCIP